MAINEFIGMRRVTIRNNATGGAGTFNVLTPDKIGSDGLTLSSEVNELTISSFIGDITTDNGVNVNAATLSLIPVSIADLAAIWPDGYDTTTKSWGTPVGGCVARDVDLAFEKVCDTKGAVLLKHCSIAPAFEMAFSRDDAPTIEVNVYPTYQAGSEYGLTGDNATQLYPYRFYDGVYDPATGTITYDGVVIP